MTISSETRKAGPFLGTGAISEYPFNFAVFTDSDLLLVSADDNGADTTLVLGTDYTVSLNADQDSSPGGEITLTAPLPLDHLLVITSEVEALQPVDLTNQGGFYPSVVNAALDRLTILIQQIKEQVSRSLKVSITSTADATPDAILAEVNDVLVSAEALAAAALGSASAASASAAAAAASAVDAAAFDPDTLGTLTFADGSFMRRADMRFLPPFNDGIFQTSHIDGPTYVGATPNGAGASSGFFAKNATVSEYVRLAMSATQASISVTKDAGEFGDSYLPFGIATTNLERLRIEADGTVKLSQGNAMIGASAYPANVASGLYVLNGVSAGGFRSHAGSAGAFTADAWNLHWNGANMALWVGTTNVGNLTITSDYRIKRDVQPMPSGALARVARLRPITYRHTDFKALNFKAADDREREGFLAHELAEVVPSAVDGEKDEVNRIQTLRLDAVVALLTKALQEQQAQIEDITQKLNGLRA